MAQKLQTLFDDLADNIERLADYETQANQYGAAEDAFDCIGVIIIRMQNLLDDVRTAAAHMEDITESRAWDDDEIEEIAKSALAKLNKYSTWKVK